jgi:hypothetical protein
MMRRTSSLLWAANYFRHRKNASQKSRPANDTHNPSPPVPGVTFPKVPRAAVDLSNLSPAARRELMTTANEEPLPTTGSGRRRGLSPAHASALALVGQALSRLRNDAHDSSRKDHLRFQVMSEVVPSLKLVLPMPILRAGYLQGDSGTSSKTAVKGKRRFVAVPTSRIPALQTASDEDVSHFLDRIISPKASGSSQSDDDFHEADPTFTLDEVTLMLQLAVKFDVKDVDLTLRLLSEFERLLLQKRREREARKQLRAEAAEKSTQALESSVPGAPSPVSRAVSVNGDFRFNASSVSRFLYFASCVGFLENHNLQLLLRFHITPLLKKHAFTPRQLVHLAVALYRFDLHKDMAFDMIMGQLASACRGTQIHPLFHHVSNVSSLPSLQCKIVKDSSIAHPTHDLSVEIVLELINCVALSVYRDDGLIAAITYRLLYLCEGASVTRSSCEGDAISGNRATHQKKANSSNVAMMPPTAEQIHFACEMFRQMEAPNEVLETALMSLASKHGIILNHGGDTRQEEGGTYTEFTGDLVKA